MNEIWKAVPQWEMYHISNLGKVVRVETQHGKPCWRIKSPKPQPNGYLRVGLTNRNLRLDIGIHQLVMLAFEGPVPDGYQVNHIDGDKENNKLKNLEYVTPRENIHHAIRNGKFPRGERQHLAKLTPEKVRQIREDRKGGLLLREIAAKYGVSICPIDLICKRKTWKHVK